MDNIIIRAFDPEKDFPQAYNCYKEGFYHILWPFIEHGSRKFNLDMIKLLYKLSPDSFVAEIDGEIHGILFGCAPEKSLNMLKCFLFAVFCVNPKLLFNLYKLNILAYKHLFQMIYGFAPFFFKQPYTNPFSEIMLFTSRNTYRNHGIGRKLMDAYMNVVKGRGLNGSYVWTDTALSYYFYESYGFKKIREFKQKAYRYSLPNEKHNAIIYYFSCE